MPAPAEQPAETLIWHNYFQKATPVTEGDKRFIYSVASDESHDLDNEKVLQKSLKESAKYFLSKGNVDIDHLTKIGIKFGMTDTHLYEIGQPVEVNFRNKETIVKSQIYKGEADVVKNANNFWDSITKCNPPQRWFPSIAGTVLKRSQDFVKGKVLKVVEAVRWNNLAFSKEPVNPNVPQAALEPITKSIIVVKTLTSGYETDAAQLEGGEAVRKESLDPKTKELTVRDKKKKKRRIQDFLEFVKKSSFNGGLSDVTPTHLFSVYKSVLGFSAELAFECAKEDFLTITQWRKSNV